MLEIKLGKIHCSNTEDCCGGDEFYVMGTVAITSKDKSYAKIITFLSKSIDINDNQNKTIKHIHSECGDVNSLKTEGKNFEDGIIFCDTIPDDCTIYYTFNAYDQDVSGSLWEKAIGGAGGWLATDMLKEGVTALLATEPAGWVVWAAGAAITYGVTKLASLDTPDKLGTGSAQHEISNKYNKSETHHFMKKGHGIFKHYSDWDYNVQVIVTNS